MSDQNKQIARRFIEAFASADTNTLQRIVAENLVDHSAPPGQQGQGRKGLLAAVEAFRVAFPDLKLTIENIVTDDDLVAVTGKIQGTHQGEMMGMPATGKHATFGYMDMYRIAHGQIIDTWHVEDIAGMLKQLGLMPV